MERILHRAFAKLLTDVADKTKTHPVIIEDYKMIFNTGNYASTMKDPKTTKIAIQREAQKRIHSILEITTESVDTPTVVVKEIDSSSIHSKLKLNLESLQKQADLESKRVETAKKEQEILTRELSALIDEKSADASKKLEALDDIVAREKQRREAELQVKIQIRTSIILEAESEKSKTEASISATKTLLQTVQEESSKGETSKIKEASRTTTSRRNSGTVFLFFIKRNRIFDACR